MASRQGKDDNFEKMMTATGGVAFSKGVDRAITVVTGSHELGKAAGEVANHVPDHVKQGAALGGLLGGGLVGHGATIGTAFAFDLAMTAFLPVVVGGAVLGGLAFWLLGDDTKDARGK